MLRQVLPPRGKSIIFRNLGLVLSRDFSEAVWLGKNKNCVRGEVIEQCSRASELLEQAQFTGGWNDAFTDGYAGDLGDWIEAAERIEVIAKKFHANRPGRCRREDVEDA